MGWRGPEFEGEFPTLGWDVVLWLERYLRVPAGPLYGRPIKLTADQTAFFVRLYGLRPDGTRMFRRASRRGPKGKGKALALDTPIPTPDGWTTMGDLSVGDLVLDENGSPTKVVRKSGVVSDHRCFLVEFRDGTGIVADAEHLWPMDEFYGSDKRRRVLVTTEEMSARVRFPRKLPSGSKCSVEGVAQWRTLPTPALDGADVDFPLPPYLLGYWLGDGDSDQPRITVGADDLAHLLGYLDAEGIESSVAPQKAGRAFRVRFGARGVAVAALRAMGVLHDKHIPARLMRGGYKQRLELLRGLMDSDGTVGVDGQGIELCLTSRRLAEDSVELIRTLGLYPRVNESDAVIDGRVVGRRWRINFTAYADEPVFALPRKMTRMKDRGPQIPYSQVRTVTAVTEVDPVPVQCIGVAAKTQTFLAGEGMVPTHNSPEGAMFCIAEFAGPVLFDGWTSAGEPQGKQRVYPWVQIAACSEEQDHNLYGPMREMLAESELSADNGGVIDLGKTRVEFKDGRPGKIEPVSASAGAREGQPITAAALEETHLWFPGRGGPKLAATLRRNAGKTGGVTCEFTNAPALGEGSVAEDTELAANKGQAGLLYDSSEGLPVESPKDPVNREALLESMRLAYGDSLVERGGWVDLERQYEECQDVDVTEADVFRFYLNLSRKAENRAFDPVLFDALCEPRPVDGPVVLAFDGARTRDCAVLTAWTVDEVPYHFHVASWVRPVNPTAGYEHPRGEIRSAVREFVGSHDVALFAYDSSFHELSSLYDEWEDEWGDLDPGKGIGLMVGYPTATGKRMEPAILRMVEDTREGLYRHDGDDLVTEHVHNAVLTKNRTGYWTLGKEKDSAKIDAAVTMTFGYDLVPMAREAVANRPRATGVFFAVA